MVKWPGSLNGTSMSSPSPIFDVSTLAVVCQGLGFSEGPIAAPDGTILLVDIKKQCLTKVLPDGSQGPVAKVPGGTERRRLRWRHCKEPQTGPDYASVPAMQAWRHRLPVR
jgi:hypothetical protein